MDVQASDNELLLKVPWTLKAGDWIRIGKARIERRDNGDLVACDEYGCTTARIPVSQSVYAAPIPALYSVLAATPYIYVDFESSVFIEDGEDYWTLAPYEIEVYVKDLAIARLSPIDVKFTLIGDIIDGILARYYRSIAAFDIHELPDPLGTAIVRFIVRGSSILLPGIGFNASTSRFYVDDNGLIYYPLLTVDAGNGVVTVKTEDKPPSEGVREIVEVRGGRRSLIGLFNQREPFTMTVEVQKRSLTTQ